MKQLLRLAVFLIYLSLAMIVLYFPLTELLAYVSRETRLFEFSPRLAAEDSLLPGLGLVFLCALFMAILRKLESVKDSARNTDSPDGP